MSRRIDGAAFAAAVSTHTRLLEKRGLTLAGGPCWGWGARAVSEEKRDCGECGRERPHHEIVPLDGETLTPDLNLILCEECAFLRHLRVVCPAGEILLEGLEDAT